MQWNSHWLGYLGFKYQWSLLFSVGLLENCFSLYFREDKKHLLFSGKRYHAVNPEIITVYMFLIESCNSFIFYHQPVKKSLIFQLLSNANNFNLDELQKVCHRKTDISFQVSSCNSSAVVKWFWLTGFPSWFLVLLFLHLLFI